jgi:hypothetical protein
MVPVKLLLAMRNVLSPPSTPGSSSSSTQVANKGWQVQQVFRDGACKVVAGYEERLEPTKHT